MNRAILEGTILQLSDDPNDTPILLGKYLGEGKEQVVFSTAPLDRIHDETSAVKIRKPRAFLEMNTRHYRLSVHPKWTNHPLRMSAEQRYELLRSEMFDFCKARIARSRCEIFWDLYHRLIRGIGSQLIDEFNSNGLPPDFMAGFGECHRQIDDMLCALIEQGLESGEFAEGAIGFFEFFAQYCRDHVASATLKGCYHPISSNTFYNLFGLWCEDFISGDELSSLIRDAIAEPSFEPIEFSGLASLTDILMACCPQYRRELQAIDPAAPEQIDVAMATLRAFWLDAQHDFRFDPMRLGLDKMRELARESLEDNQRIGSKKIGTVLSMIDLGGQVLEACCNSGARGKDGLATWGRTCRQFVRDFQNHEI
jgi:hypothetical protein